MDKGRVLVVDDKENILKLFAKIIGEAYELTTAGDGAQALALLGERTFDVVVSDIRMPGADGFEVLRAVKAKSPATEVVLMTAYASVERAVEAMKLGAYDYVTKPFDPDETALVIARALERKRLHQQAAEVERALDLARGRHRLIGEGPAMREVYELIDRAAASEVTVLLTGETGTGKELAARAIHRASARADHPWVAINCGALPAELIESELFGYAKGAFTGASTARVGLFEEAHGGTLFLDEIGELPMPLQVKLNRVLQEREIRRLGENTPIAIDVRVIAATHRDLRAEVAAGRFRDDLFYRLHVLPIRMPPLRTRRDDIPLLAAHFLEIHGRAQRKDIEGIDPDALRALLDHAWPGNVRELENTIERALAVLRGTRITLADLPEELRAQSTEAPSPAEPLTRLPYREAVDRERERISRQYLTTLMRELRGNVTRAAERAGMERESLHRLLRKYGVKSEDFKED
ncbi:MAG: sigma-54-dependent Fis family transcriptional regulator [Deltaproteobacteria bacterium]|nr:sigma-54-dependent Fis family transcriptional regulator [Deltaproteobacteria bacterium]